MTKSIVSLLAIVALVVPAAAAAEDGPGEPVSGEPGARACANADGAGADSRCEKLRRFLRLCRWIDEHPSEAKKRLGDRFDEAKRRCHDLEKRLKDRAKDRKHRNKGRHKGKDSDGEDTSSEVPSVDEVAAILAQSKG